MRNALTSLALVGLLAAEAAAGTRPNAAWRCTYTEGLRCEPVRGCVDGVDPLTWTILDEAAGLYRSCGPGPEPGSCLPSPARFGQAGQQLLVHVAGFPLFVSLSPEGTATEVAAHGQIVFIRYGRCAEGPAAPPRR